MNTKGILATVIAVVFAMAFAGCGGGGGGPAPTVVQGTSKGVITALGSVVVNGVKFSVSGANVVIDDNPNRPEAELKVGMVVTVKGMIDDFSKTGIASRVEFADNLEGPVTSIDLAANTLTVLGQLVKIVPTTVFEDTADLTTLAVNNIVEVSGFPDATGAIQATRIELKLAAPVAATPIEVKGIVANLDGTAKTFMIGALTVNFGSATLKDFPASGIANGQFVEVKGTFGQLSGSTLTAAIVELEPGMEAAENERVEVEGIVMNLVTGTTASTFTVNGVNVSAANALLAGVANGVEVEVEGNFVGGVLVAAEVKLEEENIIKLEGDVTTVNGTAGTVTLLGIPVTVTASTELRDGSSARLRTFSLADLAVGDHLEIVGFLDAGGKVIASKLERKNPDARKIIQGPVSAASQANNTLTILGATIDTASAQFEDINNAPSTAAAFFGAIALDKTVVKARGTLFGNNTLTATEVEIEEQLQ
jgi:uncharacterized protein DUF5666